MSRHPVKSRHPESLGLRSFVLTIGTVRRQK